MKIHKSTFPVDNEQLVASRIMLYRQVATSIKEDLEEIRLAIEHQFIAFKIDDVDRALDSIESLQTAFDSIL